MSTGTADVTDQPFAPVNDEPGAEGFEDYEEVQRVAHAADALHARLIERSTARGRHGDEIHALIHDVAYLAGLVRDLAGRVRA